MTIFMRSCLYAVVVDKAKIEIVLEEVLSQLHADWQFEQLSMRPDQTDHMKQLVNKLCFHVALLQAPSIHCTFFIKYKEMQLN